MSSWRKPVREYMEIVHNSVAVPEDLDKATNISEAPPSPKQVLKNFKEVL